MSTTTHFDAFYDPLAVHRKHARPHPSHTIFILFSASVDRCKAMLPTLGMPIPSMVNSAQRTAMA